MFQDNAPSPRPGGELGQSNRAQDAPGTGARAVLVPIYVNLTLSNYSGYHRIGYFRLSALVPRAVLARISHFERSFTVQAAPGTGAGSIG